MFNISSYKLCSDPSPIVSSDAHPPSQEDSQVETEQVIGNTIEYNTDGDEILPKTNCRSEVW